MRGSTVIVNKQEKLQLAVRDNFVATVEVVEHVLGLVRFEHGLTTSGNLSCLWVCQSEGRVRKAPEARRTTATTSACGSVRGEKSACKQGSGKGY